MQPVNLLLSSHPGCMWRQHLGSPNEGGHTSVFGVSFALQRRDLRLPAVYFCSTSARAQNHLGKLAIVQSFESLLFQIFRINRVFLRKSDKVALVCPDFAGEPQKNRWQSVISHHFMKFSFSLGGGISTQVGESIGTFDACSPEIAGIVLQTSFMCRQLSCHKYIFHTHRYIYIYIYIYICMCIYIYI